MFFFIHHPENTIWKTACTNQGSNVHRNATHQGEGPHWGTAHRLQHVEPAPGATRQARPSTTISAKHTHNVSLAWEKLCFGQFHHSNSLFHFAKAKQTDNVHRPSGVTTSHQDPPVARWLLWNWPVNTSLFSKPVLMKHKTFFQN